MKEALSLPCLYKVYLDTSKHSYQFATTGGAEYEVFFQQANDLFSGTDIEGADIFSVSVNKIGQTHLKQIGQIIFKAVFLPLPLRVKQL
ncbi:MAG: hypothetical protein RIE86_02125 [Imperialibacter sp.]|uniref:hypothetical protein n=1 Tax=Imperialibacter sp. TaxID=2038411 RepID=UPI0032EDCFE2